MSVNSVSFGAEPQQKQSSSHVVPALLVGGAVGTGAKFLGPKKEMDGDTFVGKLKNGETIEYTKELTDAQKVSEAGVKEALASSVDGLKTTPEAEAAYASLKEILPPEMTKEGFVEALYKGDIKYTKTLEEAQQTALGSFTTKISEAKTALKDAPAVKTAMESLNEVLPKIKLSNGKAVIAGAVATVATIIVAKIFGGSSEA